jgi:hypothetical protein
MYGVDLHNARVREITPAGRKYTVLNMYTRKLVVFGKQTSLYVNLCSMYSYMCSVNPSQNYNITDHRAVSVSGTDHLL